MTRTPPPPDDDLEPEDPPRLEPEQVGAWLLNRMKAGDRDLHTDLDLGRRSEEGARRSRELVRRELPSRLDPHDLAQAGWGVIFPRGGARKLKEPLRALLELRERQAGKLFHTFTYTKGERAANFLARHKEVLGTIRPEKVPYYLLIVGSPEEISFEFQYQLSQNHAVGRICLESPADYRRYAEAVRNAETDGVGLPRRAELFSAEHDATTRRLGKYLVLPLHHSLEDGFSDWTVKSRRKSQATKARLHKLLGGEETPGLLLVSCHGLRVEPGLEHQKARQGALRCQPTRDGGISRFTAADLSSDADVHGLISFFFACYGAGTPVLDNFPHEGLEPEAVLESEPRLLSPRPFLARLPQALLSRGALAVVGHVDRGWTLSFVWGMGTHDVSSVASLEDSLGLLLRGHRLGHALRPLHRRYCQLAARLAQMLDPQRIGVEPDKEDLRRLGVYWTAVNDARNFIIVGDPAVYLLGQRSNEDVFRLEPDLLPLVQARAKRTKTSVEKWINQTLARTLQQR